MKKAKKQLVHSDVIASAADYHDVCNIITKCNDLCEYYGARTGHYDTHASAEFYYKELGIPLAKCRRIVIYLKQQGVFYAARVAPNTFAHNDPSKGWTGFNKPHANDITYFGVDKGVIKVLLPIWQSLQNCDPLSKVLR